MVDIDTNEIFVSSFCKLRDMIDIFKHELAHIIRSNEKHDKKWLDIYKGLGGIKNNYIDFYFLHNVLHNVGNVTGIQNILTDLFLLQSYRKFSQRILATEGQWELKGDGKIRLFPTPRGSYPVVIEYFPIVNRFTNATSKEVTKRMLVAEAKIILGNARSKFGNIPAPDGGSLSLNGEQLRTEGQAEKEKALQDAILLGEPLGVYTW